jgi:pimeloyl-ACP methyl ester carboxylesterase
LAPDITRHFLSVRGRLVHYARGGSGPALAMAHGSPQSHMALLPLMRRLMTRFTVFAFDSPGYGASDPLPGAHLEISAFGDALAEALQALGLGPVPVYGTHTGASIALEASNRHPGIVSRAVLDGFALFNAQEREDLFRDHMPPLRPAWDGSHMAALWSRVRDQSVFFPWFRRGDSARRAGDPAPVASQHQAVLDLLHAGPHYATAYGASIAHDPAALLHAPDRVRLICRGEDVLISHLDRLPPGFPRAHVTAPGRDPEAWVAAIFAALEDAPSAPPPAARAGLVDGRMPPPGRHYLGGLHVRVLGAGPPLLLLHDLPGSSHTALPQVKLLARTRCVVMPDLPGWGLSAPQPGQDDPDTLAAILATAGAALGCAGGDIAGLGLGAVLACLVAPRLRARRAALLAAPHTPDPQLAEAYPLGVTPRWDGGHLLAAWYRQRDALMFAPWFDRRVATAIPLGPNVDLDALQNRVTAMLEAQGPDPSHALLLRATACGDTPCRRFPAGAAMAQAAADWLDQ